LSVTLPATPTAATGSFVITVTVTASGRLLRTTTFTLTIVSTTLTYSLVRRPHAPTVSLSSTTQTTTATVTATLTAGVSTSVTLRSEERRVGKVVKSSLVPSSYSHSI